MSCPSAFFAIYWERLCSESLENNSLLIFQENPRCDLHIDNIATGAACENIITGEALTQELYKAHMKKTLKYHCRKLKERHTVSLGRTCQYYKDIASVEINLEI